MRDGRGKIKGTCPVRKDLKVELTRAYASVNGLTQQKGRLLNFKMNFAANQCSNRTYEKSWHTYGPSRCDDNGASRTGRGIRRKSECKLPRSATKKFSSPNRK